MERKRQRHGPRAQRLTLVAFLCAVILLVPAMMPSDATAAMNDFQLGVACPNCHQGTNMAVKPTDLIMTQSSAAQQYMQKAGLRNDDAFTDWAQPTTAVFRNLTFDQMSLTYTFPVHTDDTALANPSPRTALTTQSKMHSGHEGASTGNPFTTVYSKTATEKVNRVQAPMAYDFAMMTGGEARVLTGSASCSTA